MISRLLLIMLLLCFLTMGGMYYYIDHLHSKVEDLQGYKSMAESRMQAQDTFTDKDGKSHNKTQQVELTKNTVKNVIKAGDPDLKRILKEVPKIKKNGNNLESFSSVVESSEEIFKARLTDVNFIEDATPWDSTDNENAIDSTPKLAKRFDYKTKWDSYHGIIYNDSAFVIRNGIDSLDIACYWERSWFLGAKTYNAETISGNPETKIIYTKSVIVKKKGAKKRKWQN